MLCIMQQTFANENDNFWQIIYAGAAFSISSKMIYTIWRFCVF